MINTDIKDVLPGPEVAEADRERARRYVTSHALDAEDAALLLQALGLDGDEPECPGRATWYRKNVCRCANCKRAWTEASRRLRATKKGAA